MFHNKMVTEITSVDLWPLSRHDCLCSPLTHQSAVRIALVGEQALTLALPTQSSHGDKWSTKSPFSITEDQDFFMAFLNSTVVYFKVIDTWNLNNEGKGTWMRKGGKRICCMLLNIMSNSVELFCSHSYATSSWDVMWYWTFCTLKVHMLLQNVTISQLRH